MEQQWAQAISRDPNYTLEPVVYCLVVCRLVRARVICHIVNLARKLGSTPS